jgi:glutamate-1-semialdehyde 2,1-aminomutase
VKAATMPGKSLDRARLRALMQREEERFVATHPKSKTLFERARQSLLGGVPMNWMAKWAGAFPVFVADARGAHFTDADGHEYVDLCLGDTGAMTGHSPRPAVQAIAEQAAHGITFMLPTENAIWVGEELKRRFGLPYWQFCLTATDANRFSIRLAREVTQRKLVLVFNYCYHGTVDESFITLKDGGPAPRRGNIGPPVDPALTTRVVEFNDVDALEKALASREVACVLCEPALTNVGIVHPEPGYHDALRRLTRQYGSLLIVDETHTICAGPGGFTREHNLDPDFFVLGKPLASGLPAATYGFTQEVGERVLQRIKVEDCDTGGIGGTLAGNALSLAAMRATLEHVLTPAAFRHMIPLAEQFTSGVEAAIREFGVPWHVTRLGCRAEYLFTDQRPRNGAQAAAAMDFELERLMHLYTLNRGVLLTPFHNMALMSPATTSSDVDQHTRIFREAVSELVR